jgi:hypothetical protein
MDPTAIAAALIGAQTSQQQLNATTAMERVSLQAANSVVKLLQTAQSGANSLANVGSGIGLNLNIAT